MEGKEWIIGMIGVGALSMLLVSVELLSNHRDRLSRENATLKLSAAILQLELEAKAIVAFVKDGSERAAAPALERFQATHPFVDSWRWIEGDEERLVSERKSRSVPPLEVISISRSLKSGGTLIFNVDLVWIDRLVRGFQVRKAPCPECVEISPSMLYVQPIARTAGSQRFGFYVLGAVILAVGVWLMYSVRSAREKLSKSKIELLQLARRAQLGELSAGILHELKNPLTTIHGFSKLIAAGPLSASVAEAAATLRSESTRTLEMLTLWLSFARSDSEARRAISFVDSVRQTTALYRPLALQKTVQMSEEGEFDKEIRVYAAPHELIQIVGNLIKNGLEASPGGSTLRVTLSATDRDASVSVLDEGPGFDPEVQRRIGEPFLTTKGSIGGSGLGLKITQTLVSELSGVLTIRSSGKGATVTATFPRAPS